MRSRLLLPSLALTLTACGSLSLYTESAQVDLVGPEVQVYPAGVQTRLTGMFESGPTDMFTVSAGHNRTNRRDWGEHDEETGDGVGVGVGWRRYDGPGYSGWMWGGRVDLWDLDIDWVDAPGTPSQTTGLTEVVVLQPTMLGGYRWDLGGWQLEATLGLGVEINVDTSGGDVGEGPIALAGLSLTNWF